jgi:hypothetical protein
MDAMNLYALAIAARHDLVIDRIETEGDVEILPAAVVAASEDEAKDIGRRKALEEWPPGEGWHSHEVRAVEVPGEMISAVFNPRRPT